MTYQASCCVIGDVNIDYITDLASIAIRGETNPCFQNIIKSNVGGNAVFFAEAAVEAEFKNIVVMCSVGDDIVGAKAIDYLHGLGVAVHAVPSRQNTGQVIIIYQPDDRRIMIADRGANRDFQSHEIPRCSGDDCQFDLLCVSGYMLEEDNQRSAIQTLANRFKATGSKVVVDVVPHDVWRTKSWQEYVGVCSFADIVVAELSTVSAFQAGEISALRPEEAAAFLLRDFEFCLVRINDVSDFILADRTRMKIVSIPYRRDIASLRFTDRVIAHVMRQYVEDPNLLFESDVWCSRIAINVGGSV